MRKKLLGSLALSAILLAGFSGCGGSDSATSLTGLYTDSKIIGVDYKTSSGLNGTTSSYGTFKYNSGDTVTFSIGDFILRSVAAESIIVEDKNETITLLQSIDLDGNLSNGLNLNSEIKSKVKSWLSTNNYTKVSDLNISSNRLQNVTTLIADINSTGATPKERTVIEAREHLSTQNTIRTQEKAIVASRVGVSAADVIPFGDGSFSAFERVAVFPTIKDSSGNLDYNATYAKVAALANTFAKYVANTDEPAVDSTKFKGANWILAGLESSTAANSFIDANVSHHILGIPTKLKINPNYDMSSTNTKKVKVVEICNSTYASKALGVINVGGTTGAKVQKGVYHSTALPCEVTIYNDDHGIYVDMLNPETIFTLFFTEGFLFH